MTLVITDLSPDPKINGASWHTEIHHYHERVSWFVCPGQRVPITSLDIVPASDHQNNKNWTVLMVGIEIQKKKIFTNLIEAKN